MAGKVVRGRLVAIEGGDRCGKSTQCQHILDYCKHHNLPVHYQKFPDRTTAIGRIINEYLQNGRDLNDRSIHLLFSANRWELAGEVERLLKDGVTVICDRYVPSGIAYTAAKGIELRWASWPDHGLPKPDLVLFLDAEAERVTDRGDYGGERYEKVEFQAKVRKVFEQLKDETWSVVDASQSIPKVSEQVSAQLDRLFSQSPSDAVSKYNFH